MDTFISIPAGLAAQIFAELLGGENGRGIKLNGGGYEWQIGKDLDEDTEEEMLQICVRPLLVVQKD